MLTLFICMFDFKV